MLNYDNLRSISSGLDNGSNINKETKQKLKTLLKDILEVKDAQKIGDKVVEIRNKIINELKTELTEGVKTQS